MALPSLGQDDLIWNGERLHTLSEQPTAHLDTAFRHRIKEYICQGDAAGHYYFEFGMLDREEFQSCWSIENNRLCLNRICIYEIIEEERRIWRDSTFLKELFHDYWQDGQIVATWYSGTIKCIPDGAKPIEFSGEFYTTWDKEWFFEFRNGKLLSARLEDHLVHEGTLSLWHWFEDSTCLAVWNAFPYECFPALAGCRFQVFMTEEVLDENDRMIDFTPVLSFRPAVLDEDPALEAALFEEIKKRLLQFDWTIYRIGNAFTPGRLGRAGPFELRFPNSFL